MRRLELGSTCIALAFIVFQFLYLLGPSKYPAADSVKWLYDALFPLLIPGMMLTAIVSVGLFCYSVFVRLVTKSWDVLFAINVVAVLTPFAMIVLFIAWLQSAAERGH